MKMSVRTQHIDKILEKKLAEITKTTAKNLADAHLRKTRKIYTKVDFMEKSVRTQNIDKT